MGMTPGTRIVRLTIMVGLVAAALAPAASGASATRRAASAKACAPVRIQGVQGGTQTVRVVLIGHASCATARRLARAYFHKLYTGQCGQQNNFCDLTLEGWSCSIFPAAESRQAGGAGAGCARVRGGAKVRFYTSSQQQQAADSAGRARAPRLALAAEHFVSCGNHRALHVHIQAHAVSCAKARQIVAAYLHGVVGTGNFERVKGYPAWTCSTGDGDGGCSKGQIGSGGPEIQFYYLEAPR